MTIASDAKELMGLGMPAQLANKVSTMVGALSSVTGAFAATTSLTAGTSIAAGTTVTAGGNMIFSAAAAGLRFTPASIAAAGSDQTGATQITAKVQLVTASDGTKGVKLPAAPTAGDVYIICNTVGAALELYPGTGGTINNLSANAAGTILASASAICVASSATQWYCTNGAALA